MTIYILMYHLKKIVTNFSMTSALCAARGPEAKQFKKQRFHL